MNIFMSHGRGETVPDQWQTQILQRILMYARVIYVSGMDAETVLKMHTIPAHSIEESIACARELLGKNDIKITAIPDGVSVIIQKN